MAIRNIVKKGDETLNKKCKDVTNFDEKLHILLDDMLETMDMADGVGLAAPQVGILRNIALVLDVDTDEVYEIINPKITASSGSQNDVEGCLSVPGVFGYVERPMDITVEYQDRFGKNQVLEAHGFLARVCSHEIDHLFGNLFEDKVTEYYIPEENK